MLLEMGLRFASNEEGNSAFSLAELELMPTPTMSRRWQARIEVATMMTRDRSYQAHCLYGETVDKLRQAVREYLLKARPERFRNVADHIVGRMTYFYSLGVLKEDGAHAQDLEPGWWCQEESMSGDHIQEPSILPAKRLQNLGEAVEHFVTCALIPERGPDFQSRAIVGSELRLPLLVSILRETQESPINDLIRRGWHIIALEYKGELSVTGELTNRKAVFVMGHPEAKAAELTLASAHYKRS